MTTIVGCGGRGFEDRGLVYRALDILRSELGVTRVAHGACGIEKESRWLTADLRGADRLIDAWACERGIPTVWYPVPWKSCNGDPRLMSQAAKARVAHMLAVEKPVLVAAFPGGKGTQMTMGLAHVANVPVRYIPSMAAMESIHG